MDSFQAVCPACNTPWWHCHCPSRVQEIFRVAFRQIAAMQQALAELQAQMAMLTKPHDGRVKCEKCHDTGWFLSTDTYCSCPMGRVMLDKRNTGADAPDGNDGAKPHGDSDPAPADKSSTSAPTHPASRDSSPLCKCGHSRAQHTDANGCNECDGVDGEYDCKSFDLNVRATSGGTASVPGGSDWQQKSWDTCHENNEQLRAMLARANDVLRSMWQIALREEKRADAVWTNWSAFKGQLEKVLKEQHEIMFPHSAVPAPASATAEKPKVKITRVGRVWKHKDHGRWCWDGWEFDGKPEPELAYQTQGLCGHSFADLAYLSVTQNPRENDRFKYEGRERVLVAGPKFVVNKWGEMVAVNLRGWLHYFQENKGEISDCRPVAPDAEQPRPCGDEFNNHRCTRPKGHPGKHEESPGVWWTDPGYVTDSKPQPTPEDRPCEKCDGVSIGYSQKGNAVEFYCTDCDHIQGTLIAPQQGATKAAHTERDRRVYYQSIVYDLCNMVDKANGRPPSTGVVCGTVDEPSQRLQDAVKKIIARVAELEAQRNAIMDTKMNHAGRTAAEWHASWEATRTELDAARKELAEAKAYLDFLKSKGLTVGPMKEAGKEPYLVYVIKSGSELCNLKAVKKLVEAEVELAKLRSSRTGRIEEQLRRIIQSSLVELPPGLDSDARAALALPPNAPSEPKAEGKKLLEMLEEEYQDRFNKQAGYSRFRDILDQARLALAAHAQPSQPESRKEGGK